MRSNEAWEVGAFGRLNNKINGVAIVTPFYSVMGARVTHLNIIKHSYIVMSCDVIHYLYLVTIQCISCNH